MHRVPAAAGTSIGTRARGSTDRSPAHHAARRSEVGPHAQAALATGAVIHRPVAVCRVHARPVKFIRRVLSSSAEFSPSSVCVGCLSHLHDIETSCPAPAFPVVAVLSWYALQAFVAEGHPARWIRRIRNGAWRRGDAQWTQKKPGRERRPGFGCTSQGGAQRQTIRTCNGNPACTGDRYACRRSSGRRPYPSTCRSTRRSDSGLPARSSTCR